MKEETATVVTEAVFIHQQCHRRIIESIMMTETVKKDGTTVREPATIRRADQRDQEVANVAMMARELTITILVDTTFTIETK